MAETWKDETWKDVVEGAIVGYLGAEQEAARAQHDLLTFRQSVERPKVQRFYKDLDAYQHYLDADEAYQQTRSELERRLSEAQNTLARYGNTLHSHLPDGVWFRFEFGGRYVAFGIFVHPMHTRELVVRPWTKGLPANPLEASNAVA